MKYEHPKKYKGIRNQDRARLMVEENCLNCSEFMGAEHDFTECDIPSGCPKPFKHPSVFYSADMIRSKIKEQTDETDN